MIRRGAAPTSFTQGLRDTPLPAPYNHRRCLRGTCPPSLTPFPTPPPYTHAQQALYARHLSTQLDRRHLYEVITEGAPCHAYLDLEFSTSANSGVCGDSLVNRVVLLLMAAYRERWGITLRKQVRVCV